MKEQRWHLEPVLLAGLLGLIGLGLVVLYSATGQSASALFKQECRIALALGALFVAAQIPPHLYYRLAPWLYGLGITFLILVLFFSDVHKGAQRWLDIGIVKFQPAELMKIAVPLMLARYLHDKALPPDWRTLAVCGGLIFLPVFLIMKQPDLGTSILIGSAGLFVIFFAGIAWRWILGSGALALAMLPILWGFVLHDYQKQRVLTFLNPESDPLGSGYHIIQSKIALGSGGITGKGWLAGTQSQLSFLPERHTDFIFSVLGEEFGLLGIMGLLALYAFVIVRSAYLCYHAQQTFTRLLGSSLIGIFFVYIFVNIGMVTGLLPIVGLPLPLMSYGGTSLVTLMGGFGIIMSIHTHRRLID